MDATPQTPPGLLLWHPKCAGGRSAGSAAMGALGGEYLGTPPRRIILALGAERRSPTPRELSTVGCAHCRTLPFTATLGASQPASPTRLDGEVAPKPWRFGTSPLPRRSSPALCHPIRQHLLNPPRLFSLRIAPYFSPWVCREPWPGCGARRRGEATGGAGCVRQSSRGSSDIPFGSLKMSVLETF